jgi:hypothetical protein
VALRARRYSARLPIGRCEEPNSSKEVSVTQKDILG